MGTDDADIHSEEITPYRVRRAKRIHYLRNRKRTGT